MRDATVELKALRLDGMASVWCDLAEQDAASGLDVSRWLVEHLLQAETTDRSMRSFQHQMNSACFPMQRDLAGFDASHGPIRKIHAGIDDCSGFVDLAESEDLVAHWLALRMSLRCRKRERQCCREDTNEELHDSLTTDRRSNITARTRE